MKLLLLVIFAGCFLSCSALIDPVTRISRPHVETYWESWDQTHNNYGSNLSTLPVVPIGAVGGFNVINLAFGNADATEDEVIACDISPDCVTPGLSDMKNNEAFRRAVQTIHDAGGFVKIAFGGENAVIPGEYLNQDELDFLIHRIANLIDNYELDGVDFTFKSCWNTACEHPENPIYLINTLRELMPNKIISLTFPGDYYPYDYNVIMATYENLDYVMMSRSCDQYLKYLIEMGIPRSKIVWGYIQGKRDNDHKPCDTLDLVYGVERVKAEQLGGVMTWSINSDTYYRGYAGNPGECTLYQTGQEDGTFIKTASYYLNHL